MTKGLIWMMYLFGALFSAIEWNVHNDEHWFWAAGYGFFWPAIVAIHVTHEVIEHVEIDHVKERLALERT